MKYILLIGFLFIGCEKQECWQCRTMLQSDNTILNTQTYCDKDWTEMITIADGLNTFGVTYTKCSKL